jgi:hypothetical protein
MLVQMQMLTPMLLLMLKFLQKINIDNETDAKGGADTKADAGIDAKGNNIHTDAVVKIVVISKLEILSLHHNNLSFTFALYFQA